MEEVARDGPAPGQEEELELLCWKLQAQSRAEELAGDIHFERRDAEYEVSRARGKPLRAMEVTDCRKLKRLFRWLLEEGVGGKSTAQLELEREMALLALSNQWSVWLGAGPQLCGRAEWGFPFVGSRCGLGISEYRIILYLYPILQHSWGWKECHSHGPRWMVKPYGAF